MENSIWSIIIPSLVTIIGFFINYRLIKKEKLMDCALVIRHCIKFITSYYIIGYCNIVHRIDS